MISLKIYRYLLILLILICVACIFLLFRSQIFKDKKELQIGAMWFLIILIINFGNMFYTLMYYDKNKDKKGPKGPQGFDGTRGKKGDDFECSQCGPAGQSQGPVYGTNMKKTGVDSSGRSIFEVDTHPKIKIGKCVFPFVHNNELKYLPLSETRDEEDPDNGGEWCATSLNADRTYKTFGYTNYSEVFAAQQKDNELRSKSKKDYLLRNNGILDVKLVAGNRSTVECPTGYTKIKKDLNEAAGGKYIYLCAKKGSGSTGLLELQTTQNTCPRDFRKIPYNLNKDAGGNDIFLCLKKGRPPPKNDDGDVEIGFINDIKVQNGKECQEGYDLVNTKTGGLQNMNSGAGGNEIYVCTNNKPSIDLIAIDAAFLWGENKKLYFFKGEDYWEYDSKTGMMNENYPKKINQFWGEIPRDIDAVFTWGFNNKTYFFKGSLCWQFDAKRQEIAPGFPRLIKDIWKGIPNNIDAVFTWGKDGKTYFFKDQYYYRFNDKTKKVDRGYPKKIERRWVPKDGGKGFANLNAIFTHSDRKTYIIKADEYWMLGNDGENMSGYPRKISGKFGGIY